MPGTHRIPPLAERQEGPAWGAAVLPTTPPDLPGAQPGLLGTRTADTRFGHCDGPNVSILAGDGQCGHRPNALADGWSLGSTVNQSPFAITRLRSSRPSYVAI
jgi:hypothetical protein